MKARLFHPLTLFAAYLVLPLLASQFFYHASGSVSDSTLKFLYATLRTVGAAILITGMVSAVAIWRREKRLPLWARIGTLLCVAALSLRVLSSLL